MANLYFAYQLKIFLRWAGVRPSEILEACRFDQNGFILSSFLNGRVRRRPIFIWCSYILFEISGNTTVYLVCKDFFNLIPFISSLISCSLLFISFLEGFFFKEAVINFFWFRACLLYGLASFSIGVNEFYENRLTDVDFRNAEFTLNSLSPTGLWMFTSLISLKANYKSRLCIL